MPVKGIKVRHVAPTLLSVAWYRMLTSGPAVLVVTSFRSVMTKRRHMTTRKVVITPKTTDEAMQRGASRRGLGISPMTWATASTVVRAVACVDVAQTYSK